MLILCDNTTERVALRGGRLSDYKKKRRFRRTCVGLQALTRELDEFHANQNTELGRWAEERYPKAQTITYRWPSVKQPPEKVLQ